MPTASHDEDPLATALVSAGNLYLSSEACARYLPGVESIALLEHDAQVLIVPLTRASGGGLLLKVRNARGDRVVHAQEFFRTHGYVESFETRSVPMRWDEATAALVLANVPRAVP